MEPNLNLPKRMTSSMLSGGDSWTRPASPWGWYLPSGASGLVRQRMPRSPRGTTAVGSRQGAVAPSLIFSYSTSAATTLADPVDRYDGSDTRLSVTNSTGTRG